MWHELQSQFGFVSESTSPSTPLPALSSLVSLAGSDAESGIVSRASSHHSREDGSSDDAVSPASSSTSCSDDEACDDGGKAAVHHRHTTHNANDAAKKETAAASSSSHFFAFKSSSSTSSAVGSAIADLLTQPRRLLKKTATAMKGFHLSPPSSISIASFIPSLAFDAEAAIMMLPSIPAVGSIGLGVVERVVPAAILRAMVRDQLIAVALSADECCLIADFLIKSALLSFFCRSSDSDAKANNASASTAALDAFAPFSDAPAAVVATSAEYEAWGDLQSNLTMMAAPTC